MGLREPDSVRLIALVLWNDPVTGVMRRADAGYEDAVECARGEVKSPMV